jgi:hypothetical protein
MSVSVKLLANSALAKWSRSVGSPASSNAPEGVAD